ncbi:MAG: hypothetical protein LBB67_03520 [Oscillospiraceae bacterium]|jgi:hypothetical protein|nr:hypothetical protein [Oscillospiraceae bacterium]
MLDGQIVFDAIQTAARQTSGILALWDMSNLPNEEVVFCVDTQTQSHADAILDIELALDALSPIDHIDKFPMNPQNTRFFYYLTNAAPSLVIEVLFRAYAQETYRTSKQKPHQRAILRFEAIGNVVSFEQNAHISIDMRGEAAKRIRQATALRGTCARVINHAKRGQFCDALHAYTTYAIAPLVVLLRECYCPSCVSDSIEQLAPLLPAFERARFEKLLKIASIADIENNCRLATMWFDALHQNYKDRVVR